MIVNWIDKVKHKWQGIYDFSNTDFKRQKDAVTVVCNKHGAFSTTGASLVNNKACCPVCIKVQYALRTQTRKQTCLDKYGVDNPMKNDSIKSRLKQSVHDKYGVDNAACLLDVKQKRKDTMLKKYGATSYIGSDEGKARIAQTNKNRYGTENFMQSDFRFDVLAEMKEKSRNTQLKRYGAKHYSQSAEAHKLMGVRKEKEFNTKFINGTLNTSTCESLMERKLKDYFGDADVLCQYKSNVYPFACDFYIKSLNLYIELNAHWTHGNCMFSQREKNSEFYNELMNKKDNKYYAAALHTWTDLDVRKRECARKHHLNYLIFWDTQLRDVDIWLNCGAPIGHDYFEKYTWLHDFNFNETRDFKLSSSFITTSQIMKKYQFNVFYKRELALWHDGAYKSHLDLRMFMLYNRLMYKHKNVLDLTGKDILQGMSIAGILRGYTVFDNRLMLHVLKQYRVKSVYDPFAGWGERLLTCGVNGVKYTGVDVRSELKNGYDAMINDYSLKDAEFIVGDSRYHNIDKHYDAVITCPPYLSTEVYSDKGLENLDKKAFIEACEVIFKKVHDAGIKIVALQTNQACKQMFSDILVACGYKFVEETSLPVKASHLNKHKSEYETMIVYGLS